MTPCHMVKTWCCGKGECRVGRELLGFLNYNYIAWSGLALEAATVSALDGHCSIWPDNYPVAYAVRHM